MVWSTLTFSTRHRTALRQERNPRESGPRQMSPRPRSERLGIRASTQQRLCLTAPNSRRSHPYVNAPCSSANGRSCWRTLRSPRSKCCRLASSTRPTMSSIYSPPFSMTAQNWWQQVWRSWSTPSSNAGPWLLVERYLSATHWCYQAPSHRPC